jgi:hypothetical protein
MSARDIQDSRRSVVLDVSSLHPELYFVSPSWALSGHDAHQLHFIIAGSITDAGELGILQ